jgi:hypothetical protein
MRRKAATHQKWVASLLDYMLLGTEKPIKANQPAPQQETHGGYVSKSNRDSKWNCDHI